MSKKINETGLRSVIVFALSAEAVLAEVLLLITSYLIPAPFAEYVAFFYIYSKGGNLVGMLVFGFLFCASIALCMYSATEKHKDSIIFRILAALFIAADLGVHSYVFLAGSGYGWNYLISAVLDAVLLVAVIFRPKRKRENGEESEDEKA